MVQFERRKRPEQTRERVRKLRFERMVAGVLRSLPPHIVAMMDNVDVVVADEPTPEQHSQLEAEGADSLFGLYEGIPLTHRAGYNLALPDKITIFRRPLEAVCDSEEEMIQEIRVTVLHELAHHLGFDEDRIDELGLG